LFRVFEFESHQKADHFETLATFIDVVTQEKVIKAANVTRFTWRAPNVKESHQINVVAVNVAENFNWWL
jgi:hypothetical protein